MLDTKLVDRIEVSRAISTFELEHLGDKESFLKYVDKELEQALGSCFIQYLKVEKEAHVYSLHEGVQFTQKGALQIYYKRIYVYDIFEKQTEEKELKNDGK